MRDEFDVIDLIEPDVGAFASPHDQVETAPHRPRRQWVAPVAISTVIALAGVAGFLVWSPRHDDYTISFPDRGAPALTLTDELVFANPPGVLTAASLEGATEDQLDVQRIERVGYIFAEPGASVDFNRRSTGRWAVFFAFDSTIAPDPTGMERATEGTVQGASAVISSTANQLQIDFGPVDGRVFHVVTSKLSRTESLAFAEAVGIDDGTPVLTGDVLGTMEPLGDIADYSVVTSTFFQAVFPSGERPGISSVHYSDSAFDLEGDGRPTYSVASQPVASYTTLETLRFFLDGEEATVHGLPAIVVDAAARVSDTDDNWPSAVVAWVEGGRLIVVTGSDDVAATLALAETVREATNDEWAQVVTVAQDPIASVEVATESVTLYEGVDSTTGNTFGVGARFVDGELEYTCVHETAAGDTSTWCDTRFETLPLFTTDERNGRQFVVAVIDRDAGAEAELRITLVDGTIETFLLEEVSSGFPGPAVATLLPAGHGAVELWIGGEVVATI